MNSLLKTFLSMSAFGSLLILALLAGRRLWQDRLSRQWQYYIWLAVILRLLTPFGAEVRLPDPSAGYAADAPVLYAQDAADVPCPPGADVDPPEVLPAAPTLQDAVLPLLEQLWLVWLAVAAGMLIRKITIYQSFARYVSSGSTPVADVELLDRLAAAVEEMGVRRPVELYVNPLVSSPLLTGFFHPCIVLPSEDISEKDFRYIALHELTHCKRRDMFYKWLVQVTVCLHWFNPLVHFMGREITRACEFSCDEAVVSKTGYACAREYGRTLLNAMAAVGKYKESFGAVTLSENKQMLKERITSIMNFQKKSTAVRLLTCLLTACILFGAAFAGAGRADAADLRKPADDPAGMGTMTVKGVTWYLVSTEAQLRAIGTDRYGMDQNYMQQADIQLSAGEWIPIGTWDEPFTGTFNGNGFEIKGLTMTDPDAEIVGLFGVALKAHIYNVTLRDYDITRAGKNASEKSVGAVLAVGQGSLSYDNFVYPKENAKEQAQKNEESLAKAEKYYEAGSLPLFGFAFSRMDEAEQEAWLDRIYADNAIAFFSVAADCLDEDTLEDWLDRALEDGKRNFQSMLFNKLNRVDEWDELEAKKEKEWAEAQTAEYKAAGVTIDGKNYYYKGQLVNIFLDVRPNKSFYTLDINPAGTINIKIVRNKDNEITGVAYMTDKEVEELLSDMRDDDELEIISIDLKTVADGKVVWLGDYALSEGDRIWYDVSAKTGSKMQTGFAKAGDERLNTTYYSVLNSRTDGALEITADFTVGPPVRPGTYRLFLRAADGALGNVRGTVSIAKADAF